MWLIKDPRKNEFTLDELKAKYPNLFALDERLFPVDLSEELPKGGWDSRIFFWESEEVKLFDIVAEGTWKTEWIPLGYGTYEEVVKRLPTGEWTIIRDDDAAAVGADNCWWATKDDPSDAEQAYVFDGGTVSCTYEYRVQLPNEFVTFAQEEGIDLRYGEDYLPWFKCWVHGFNAALKAYGHEQQAATIEPIERGEE
jgi:hypothetical protein